MGYKGVVIAFAFFLWVSLWSPIEDSGMPQWYAHQLGVADTNTKQTSLRGSFV
jgi:hypothetical protein